MITNVSTLGEQSYSKLKNQICQIIRIGMRRSEVEQILRDARGGVQGPEVTIYHLEGAKVEVAYTRFGQWSEQEDSVIEPPKIFLELQA